jgi:Predicted membrane protein (DUF2142)
MLGPAPANRWFAWCSRNAWRFALSLVVVGACLLATYWAFLVPIFEQPDEPQHFDYALSIYSAGGLLNARDRPTLHTGESDVAHPDLQYLVGQTSFDLVHHHPGTRMPPTYGTTAYFNALDAGAPPLGKQSVPLVNPALLTLYPFGYYALLAGWVAIVTHLTTSLTAVFFAARLLSVALLCCSLLLTFAIAAQLGLGRWRSILLTALVGFLPLTTFVSSSIQPDNLSFALVSFCILMTVRARRGMSLWTLTLLGAGLGLLLVTKVQFFLCLLPVLVLTLGPPLLRTGRRRSSLASSLVVLVLPSVVLGAVSLWVVWGSSPQVYSTAAAGYPNTEGLRTAIAHGVGGVLRYALITAATAGADFYVGGATFSSFWGEFGWLDAPLVIASSRVNLLVDAILLLGTIGALWLMVIRTLRLVIRLRTTAARLKLPVICRLTARDPFLSTYLVFTSFMFLLYFLTAGTFGPQGRNWIPFLLPTLMIATRYAPEVLKGAKRVTSGLVLTALATYCLLGSIYAVRSIESRFYGATDNVQTRASGRPVNLSSTGDQPPGSGRQAFTVQPVPAMHVGLTSG